MLNINHSSLMRIRKACLALQCQIDNTPLSAVSSLVVRRLKNIPPGDNMWNGRLFSIIKQFSGFVRTLPRDLRREWLYKLMVDASGYLRLVSAKRALPQAVFFNSGESTSNAFDEQYFWLMSRLLPGLTPQAYRIERSTVLA